WTEQPKEPGADANTRTFSMEFSQRQPVPPRPKWQAEDPASTGEQKSLPLPLHIPLEIGFVSSTGARVNVATAEKGSPQSSLIAELRHPTETITITTSSDDSPRTRQKKW